MTTFNLFIAISLISFALLDFFCNLCKNNFFCGKNKDFSWVTILDMCADVVFILITTVIISGK